VQRPGAARVCRFRRAKRGANAARHQATPGDNQRWFGILGGDITTSDESLEVKFWPVQNIDNLDMHPSIRQRISHYLSSRSEAFIA
jgi:hypothetical protein